MTDLVSPSARDRAHEAFAARDKKFAAAVFAVFMVIMAFAFGRIAEADRAMTAARQAMAERQPHLQKAAREKAEREVMSWFEATWPCKGFDIHRECNLRERRP